MRKRSITEEDYEIIIEMYKKGKPIKEIGKRIKKSHTSVYKYLKELGLM